MLLEPPLSPLVFMPIAQSQQLTGTWGSIPSGFHKFTLILAISQL